MVDAIAILKEVRSLGSAATLADVQAQIASVDHQALESVESSRYSIAIWDGMSPLAGVPAEHWKSRQDWCGGSAYVISVDGVITLVQLSDPKSAGYVAMSAQVATGRANEVVGELVSAKVDTLISKQVIESLLLKM